MFVGAKVEEELVDVIEHDCRTGVAAIDLVDRHDHREMARHRLLEDIARLRERAFRGIHEQQHRIDHEQRPLDLAAEVRVTRGVDDVEADPVVVDRGLLGEDRDALLALEIARIHHPVHDGLVGAERAGLAEHGVHERGLAMVHVGDDRDVAQVRTDGGGHDGTGHGGIGHGRAAVSHISRFDAAGRGRGGRAPGGRAPRPGHGCSSRLRALRPA